MFFRDFLKEKTAFDADFSRFLNFARLSAAPIISLFLRFLVRGALLAPFAKLHELDLALDFLAVLGRPVIDALALLARELDKVIL